MMEVYEKRDRAIRSIGFSSYRDYLNSDLWHEIRKTVLGRSRKCTKCKGKATQVHHARYLKEDLLGKTLSYLNPVCASCHHNAEYDRNGQKNELGKANEILGTFRRDGTECRVCHSVMKKGKRLTCRKCRKKQKSSKTPR